MENLMDKTVNFKLGELFCGPGGIAYGALHAQSDDGKLKITHAWANDFDRDTCDTYIKISARIHRNQCTVWMYGSWILSL